VTKIPARSTQVLVVGAGPVGLFAALCAAQRGLEVELLDQSWQGFGRGYATILHPRSLKLLAEAGLREELQAAGRPIDRIGIHVGGRAVAMFDLESPVLALAQSTLEEALLRALRAKGIAPVAPVQASAIVQDDHGVEVRVVRRELVRLGTPAEYADWEPVESSFVRADFVIGADGYESRVRTALGIDSVTVGSTETFAVFEFATNSRADWLDLSFDGELGSAMVPLPNGRARWAFQIDRGLDRFPDIEHYRSLVASRAPWYRDGVAAINWGTVTQFERRIARTFGKGRVWLAGDAAHVTSPFGGQSMNGGLFEAYDLARRIADSLSGKAPRHHLDAYGEERRREWDQQFGVNVEYDLLPKAPDWLAPHARRLVASFPAMGRDVEKPLERLGLRLS